MKVRQAIRPTLICLTYLGLHFGSALATNSVTHVPLFGIRPAAGLAVALLLVAGPRYFLAVVAANYLTTYLLGSALPERWMDLAFPMVEASGYAITAWLVRRELGLAPIPRNRREAGLLISAIFAAPLPWALTISSILHRPGVDSLNGILPGAAFRMLGGAASILSIAPVAVVYAGAWLYPERRWERRAPSPSDRFEKLGQASALVLTFWLSHFWPPLRGYASFPLYFVTLAWIALSRGLPGATLTTFVLYLANYTALCLTDTSRTAIFNLMLFAVAFAAVGLGLGTAVNLRDRAEVALKASQDRLARVHAGSRLGLWDCDFTTRRVAYDDAWAEMLGFSLAEVPADLDWWAPRIHPEDRGRVDRLLEEHLAGRTPFYEAEFRFRTRDGSWKWIAARGSVTARDSAGRPLRFAGTQLDLTDRKLAEEEKARMTAMMVQAQKLESLGVMAGGVAHDFNNLLTVMLGNISLVQLEVAAGSPALPYLQLARSSALRASELCRQLLAYSGRGQISPSLADLSSLVEDTSQLLQVSIHKGLTVKLELDRSLPPVRVDPVQIRQIVMNLVINASDAIGPVPGLIRLSTGLTRADSVTFAQAYASADLPEGEYAFLAVTDTGCGMTAEVKARIFEPFFTTKFAGRGLGLAAVLGIVRAHGGALTVASEPGRGSTFTLLLPVAEGMAEAPAPAVPSVAAHSQGAVLVVDDEEPVRTVASRLLETCGYEPVPVDSGREALRLFRADPGRFRAVLLDLTMPEMNGEETLREIRRLDPSLPVVLMSGFSEDGAAVRRDQDKFTSFIPKPFERADLAAALQSATRPVTP